MTVARGWEGRGVDSSQRSYDRWAGRGGGGGGVGGGGGGPGKGSEWVRGGEGRGGKQRWGPVRGPGRQATFGPSGPPLWACRALHSEPIGPVISGSVRPAQHKARGLATGLKKN